MLGFYFSGYHMDGELCLDFFFLLGRHFCLSSFLFYKERRRFWDYCIEQKAPRHWDLGENTGLGWFFAFYLFLHDGYWEYYIGLG